MLNRAAVELAIRGALALNCTIRPHSRFARKNYFYPDLPKGYQISQYDEPLAEHGYVDIDVDGAIKRIGVTRVHMEDDAGKSIHDGFKDSDRYTYVDLNRCGTPLIEIVSEPDMRSSDEAYAYLTEVKQALQFVEVSTCDMEKGHLRCDANVSVRLKGAEKFGTKAEVKNLNSFRFLKQAIDYEIARQVAMLESGGRVVQETRLYDAESRRDRSACAARKTRTITAIFPSPIWCRCASARSGWPKSQASMPELPARKRARFIEDYGLREYDADVLTAIARRRANISRRRRRFPAMRRRAANWVMGDLMAALKAEDKDIAESPGDAPRIWASWSS